MWCFGTTRQPKPCSPGCGSGRLAAGWRVGRLRLLSPAPAPPAHGENTTVKTRKNSQALHCILTICGGGVGGGGVAKLNGASYTVHFVENQRNELCWMYRLGPAPNRTTPPRTKKPAAGRKPGDRLRAVSAYCSSGRTTVEPEPAPAAPAVPSTPGHLPAAMSSFLRSTQKSAFLMPRASGSKCGSIPAFFWRR